MSVEPNSKELEERIERLEFLVAQLVDQSQVSSAPPKLPLPPAVPASLSAAATSPNAGASPRPKSGPRHAQAQPESIDSTGERWLARGGVLFLFLALSFLFKYAFDHGFITPSLRLALGFTLASTLMGFGLKLHKTRLRYSQILLGGSISMFYLVGFASHQLYGLVPHTPAFAYMVVVTITALLLSMRQDHPSLACIGASGGLMTPFLLETPEGTIPALVLYFSTILFGASLILMRRGWRTLLLTLWFGGFPVLFYTAIHIDSVDRPFLWVGIITWWMVGGWLPFLYNWKASAFPKPTARESFPAGALRAGAALSTVSAVAVILGTWDLWEPEQIWPVFLCFGIFYLLQSAWSRNNAITLKVSVELAVVLMVATTCYAWTYDAAYWVLLLEVLAIFQLSKRAAFSSIGYLAHGMMIGLSIWFLGVSIQEFDASRGFDDPDLHMLTRLGHVPLLLWAGRNAAVKEVRTIYSMAAHLALLLWSASVLNGFENGAALTSAAWAAQGVAILLVGMKMSEQKLKGLGLGTLALVAGKMLMVDMAQMDMIWRILMFFGVGGAFLALSFLINRPAKTA